MIKALTRENVVADIRTVLKERYGTMQAAADALGLETRELRCVTGMAKARQGKRSCNLEVQVKVLKQLGLEIRYDVYEIVKAGDCRAPHALMATPLVSNDRRGRYNAAGVPAASTGD